MEPLIRVENLTFCYNDEEGGQAAPAIDHLELTVERGSFVAITGSNGSGKSTLAKHFNALLLPTEGRVLVDGMDTADEEKIWDIRRMIGMVFQNPDNQLVSSVVEDDVAFGAENLGIPSEEIR
ncbi:MAG: ATP-binding cassette domain-containing protein, partial [Firmicutes bacterium]|nr:ATP-binding cassette domain-containing protein [Bacillota bacterium]